MVENVLDTCRSGIAVERTEMCLSCGSVVLTDTSLEVIIKNDDHSSLSIGS